MERPKDSYDKLDFPTGLRVALVLTGLSVVVTLIAIWVLDHPAVKDACLRFHGN